MITVWLCATCRTRQAQLPGKGEPIKCIGCDGPKAGLSIVGVSPR